MVLRHKHCVTYAKVALKYGCHCGVSPNKDCKEDGDEPRLERFSSMPFMKCMLQFCIEETVWTLAASSTKCVFAA